MKKSADANNIAERREISCLVLAYLSIALALVDLLAIAAATDQEEDA
jgi:hypothetical protein